MSEKFTIICTGAPGSGRDEILSQVREKSSFFYYHLFEYIVEEAKKGGYNLNKFNVLDFYDSQPNKLENFRIKALEKIINEIKSRKGVHIVSTPYHFEWKGRSYKGLTEEEINNLNPDMFLVIIDDLIRVKERLKEDPQWKDLTFSLAELAQWRREEVAGVYNLAHNFTPFKKFYIVTSEHGWKFLYDIIFNRQKKKIYLSHPITGEGKKFFDKVTKFSSSLSKHYSVFDPYMVKDWAVVDAWRSVQNKAKKKHEEISSKINFSIRYSEGLKEYGVESQEIKAAIKNIRFLIIDTDYKIIETVDNVVVYHPREQISAGVICEMVYAKSLAKFVYVFYPFEPSPFFEWYSTKIFTEEEKLIEFLKKQN